MLYFSKIILVKLEILVQKSEITIKYVYQKIFRKKSLLFITNKFSRISIFEYKQNAVEKASITLFPLS